MLRATSERLLDKYGPGGFTDEAAGKRIGVGVGVRVAPIRADVEAPNEPGQAQLPVGVVKDAVRNTILAAAVLLAANVGVERPLIVDGVVGRQIEVPGVIGNTEGMVDA